MPSNPPNSFEPRFSPSAIRSPAWRGNRLPIVSIWSVTGAEAANIERIFTPVSDRNPAPFKGNIADSDGFCPSIAWQHPGPGRFPVARSEAGSERSHKIARITDGRRAGNPRKSARWSQNPLALPNEFPVKLHGWCRLARRHQPGNCTQVAWWPCRAVRGIAP